jgi:hypothetical protein
MEATTLGVYTQRAKRFMELTQGSAKFLSEYDNSQGNDNPPVQTNSYGYSERRKRGVMSKARTHTSWEAPASIPDAGECTQPN